MIKLKELFDNYDGGSVYIDNETQRVYMNEEIDNLSEEEKNMCYVYTNPTLALSHNQEDIIMLNEDEDQVEIIYYSNPVKYLIAETVTSSNDKLVEDKQCIADDNLVFIETAKYMDELLSWEKDNRQMNAVSADDSEIQELVEEMTKGIVSELGLIQMKRRVVQFMRTVM